MRTSYQRAATLWQWIANIQFSLYLRSYRAQLYCVLLLPSSLYLANWCQGVLHIATSNSLFHYIHGDSQPWWKFHAQQFVDFVFTNVPSTLQSGAEKWLHQWQCIASLACQQLIRNRNKLCSYCRNMCVANQHLSCVTKQDPLFNQNKWWCEPEELKATHTIDCKW